MAYPMNVNGTPIKTPTSFRLGRYNLTKSGRVSSGKMTMELKAKKRKIFISYSALFSSDLINILNLIDTDEMFFTVGFYTENETYTEMTCYVGAIDVDLHYRPEVSDESVWKDIKFNFIQQ